MNISLKKMKKNGNVSEYVIFLVLVIVFSIIFVLCVRKIDSLSPIGLIDGIYYTTYYDGNYNASFESNTFKIERNNETISRGTYERVNNTRNVYLLTDIIQGTAYLAVLDATGFYFLDQTTNQISHLMRN